MQKECEVGDLVYDPVMGDMGIITGLNGSSFNICWYIREGYNAGYCLAVEKEKYYESR